MMKRDVGDPAFPIWLLGDSNPPQWEGVLTTPLDPRHPARHSIWTPVLDQIQDRVYRLCGDRMDTSSLYIRNAVASATDKPAGKTKEWVLASREAAAFRELLDEHRPVLLISFGAFSFEFARRVLAEEPQRPYAHWGARGLGEQFRERVCSFDLSRTNLLPLLHVSIARGKFIQSHEYFCGRENANYFCYVGDTIGEILVRHRHALPVWIARAGEASLPSC